MYYLLFVHCRLYIADAHTRTWSDRMYMHCSFYLSLPSYFDFYLHAHLVFWVARVKRKSVNWTMNKIEFYLQSWWGLQPWGGPAEVVAACLQRPRRVIIIRSTLHYQRWAWSPRGRNVSSSELLIKNVSLSYWSAEISRLRASSNVSSAVTPCKKKTQINSYESFSNGAKL